MAKKEKSELVKRETRETKPKVSLTPEESVQYNKILERISFARSQRESDWDYFDSMSYSDAYLANKRAAMSYLVPKTNDSEVRINTGLTEKRIEVVLSELLGQNLEAEIKTFDRDDNFKQDLSEVFTDLNKRTEQIELSDDKDIFIYQELLTQPSVFVEELWVENFINNSTKRRIKPSARCERRLLLGPQVYLGDIHLPDYRFNEQPFIVKYARVHKVEAERLFKDLNPEKWEQVSPGNYSSIGTDTNIYKQNSLQQDEMELFVYMSYPDNEVQMILQGVPFLPVGAKYTEYFGDLGGYHITMVSLKPYSGDFAYGKPLTQSAKTLQALNNETIRNMIRKFRQALEPPIGTAPGKMFNRDIWNPGKITQNLRKNDFEKLIDHGGVTRSEMAMFDLIEKKTNEFIGSSQQPPLAGGERTATEHVLAQQQAVKLLGLAVLACMRLKERLALLRVRNILENYTKPTGTRVNPITNKLEDTFARFTLSGADFGDSEGEEVIQFADRGLTEPETQELFRREEEMAKKGRNVRFKILNINFIKNLELYFYAVVSSKPRESTELEKAMVMEKLQQGQVVSQITGRPMKAGKLIRSWERAWRDNGLFERDAPTSINQLQEQFKTGEIKQRASSPGESLRSLSRETRAGEIPQL